jgi:hypothetical protein
MSYFIAFCSKNSLFVPKYTLVNRKLDLTQNSFQVSHHLQGGMKFATQISPLLNYSYKGYQEKELVCRSGIIIMIFKL